MDVNLEDLLKLGPEVDCFLQESAGGSKEESRGRSSPEPPVEEYERWVTLRAQAHDMPDWWQELAEVPKVDGHQKLAREVWASFELPWQISKKMVAYAQDLQFWVEKTNLPTQGQPHLLVGSVLELREEIKCYVSFPDEAIFSSMALPEESLATRSRETRT